MSGLPDIPWADEQPSHLADALQLAQSGLHIFPLKAKDKVPATAHGFKNATRDPNQIKAWWNQNPAYNIGVATGASGLLVVDIDGPAGEETWRNLHEHHPLVDTLTVTTGRGRHLYYRHDHQKLKLGNSVKKKIGPDVDTRGEGGYVIAPPSVHPSGRLYQWADPAAAVEALPDHLVELLKPKERQAPVAAPAAPRRSPDGLLPYVTKALADEIATLAGTTSGRNDALNRAAYNLGQLVGAHVLDRATAESELHAAAHRNGHVDKHGDTKTRGTIQSGLNSGEANPRSIPEPRSNVVQHPTARQAPGPAADYGDSGPTDEPEGHPEQQSGGGDPPGDDDHDTVLGAPYGNGGDIFRADLLVELHGNKIRHVPGIGWYSYDGIRWALDFDDKAVGRLYRATMDRLRRYALQLPKTEAGEQSPRAKRLLSEAKRGASANSLSAGLRLARNDLRIHLGPDDLDRDDWLVNFPNGTLELRTGKFRSHDPNDNISYVLGAPYRKDARHERLEQFLVEVMGGDQEQADALTRHFGLALTGDTSARKALFPHGPTTTGKSVFLDVMAAALGDYGKATKFEMFLARQFGRQAGGPEPELLALRGRRFVYASEADEHSKLSQGLFKGFVSGDAQDTRGMHSGVMVTFRPKALLCFASNERPQVNARDGAMWERIIQIPFLSQPPKRDPRLRDKLLTEDALAAMLRMLVDGFRAYRKDGLQTPSVWQEYTEEYQLEQDWLAEFLSDRCVVGEQFEVGATSLHQAYRSWYEENVGDKPKKQKAFGAELKKAGFQKVKKSSYVYTGLRVRFEGELPPPALDVEGNRDQSSLTVPSGTIAGRSRDDENAIVPSASSADDCDSAPTGPYGTIPDTYTHKNSSDTDPAEENKGKERGETVPHRPVGAESQSHTGDSSGTIENAIVPSGDVTSIDAGDLW